MLLYVIRCCFQLWTTLMLIHSDHTPSDFLWGITCRNISLDGPVLQLYLYGPAPEHDG